MPSDFTRSPQLLKGKLLIYGEDTQGAQPVTVPFQYNPTQLRRTLVNRTPPPEPHSRGGAPEDVRRVGGPPVETITMTIELDAADQLAEPDQHDTVVQYGLYPALATLEMLLYPPSMRFQENQRLAQQGEVQVEPADLPLTVLEWGEARRAPVVVTSFSVTEEAFDPNLNPIQAKVELGVQVLTYMELDPNSVGRDTYISYQKEKESQARKHQSADGQTRTRDLRP